MGEFSAKLRFKTDMRQKPQMGPNGYADRNSRGDMPLNCMLHYELYAMNSSQQHSKNKPEEVRMVHRKTKSTSYLL